METVGKAGRGTAGIAEHFAALLREGRGKEAEDTWSSDDIRSIEAAPGPFQDIRGRAALAEKHAWWEANATVHGMTMKGPMVNGDQFVLVFEMDVTMTGMERMQMEEVALYTVRDGKIAEERFFYRTGP